MRIVEIIPSFIPLGGAENFVFNLSSTLKNNENEVLIVSLFKKKNDFIESKLAKENIPIFYLEKKKGIDFKSMRVLKKVLNELKPDIVHLHLNSIICSLPSILSKKYKFIFTFHTFIDKKTYGRKTSFKNLLMKSLFKKKLIYPVTISDTVDNSFKEFFGNIETKIIYNGVDIKKFKYFKGIKKEYDFISIGSFNDIKNNLFMLECFKKVRDSGHNANYLLIGNGKNYESCYNFCLKNNLLNHVTFAGVVNNVEDYLAKSKCLLLASHWEGNPLVVNEALASGVWVIANSVGGIVDLLDETCGYLTIPESMDDFTSKMILFLKLKNKIESELIPDNIDKNRDRVDIAKTAIFYQEFMKNIMEKY